MYGGATSPGKSRASGKTTRKKAKVSAGKGRRGSTGKKKAASQARRAAGAKSKAGSRKRRGSTHSVLVDGQRKNVQLTKDDAAVASQLLGMNRS